MSGGAFDYAYQPTYDFAQTLRMRLETKLVEWNDDVMRVLRNIAAVTHTASRLMHEVEWLYSGDTGEESFLERVAAIDADVVPKMPKPHLDEMLQMVLHMTKDAAEAFVADDLKKCNHTLLVMTTTLGSYYDSYVESQL